MRPKTRLLLVETAPLSILSPGGARRAATRRYIATYPDYHNTGSRIIESIEKTASCHQNLGCFARGCASSCIKFQV